MSAGVKILGASPEAFSAQSQLQLPFMQLLVICLLTVIRDIRRDHALAAVLPHRVYEVTFSPELSAPQLLLHLRCFRKHFAIIAITLFTVVTIRVGL